MRGFIGTDAALNPGHTIITGRNREIRMVVVGPATEERARKSAQDMGHSLEVVPGERFYEVEITARSVGSDN